MATLRLGDTFGNVKIQIDITTFRYDGHTAYYEWPSSQLDSHIQFCMPTEEETESTVQRLQEELGKKYRVEVDEYVRAYEGDHFKYHSPQRRTIKIRLPSGSKGISNPAYFSFSE